MEKIFIFGTGSGSQKFYSYIGENEFTILGFLDNDEKKQGTYFHSHMIYSPDMVNQFDFDKIIICSFAYDQIKRQLISEYMIPESKIENRYYANKKRLLQYYCAQKNLTDEMRQALQNIERRPLEAINYDFVDEYKELSVKVYKDFEADLFYVYYDNKKMYFSKEYNTVEKVQNYCKYILLEQDPRSPHKYTDNSFNVKNHDIVIDAGVAEGNFALSVIDYVDRIYLIEADPDWIEALQHTFAPYKEKVILINKYLTDHNDEKCITIDEILMGEKVDFIKMDIEGAEVEALIGAKHTLENNNVKLALCAYHRESDEEDIIEACKKYGYDFTTSKGYMVFIVDENWNNHLEPKKLVRGILRGKKNV